MKFFYLMNQIVKVMGTPQFCNDGNSKHITLQGRHLIRVEGGGRGGELADSPYLLLLVPTNSLLAPASLCLFYCKILSNVPKCFYCKMLSTFFKNFGIPLKGGSNYIGNLLPCPLFFHGFSLLFPPSQFIVTVIT